MGFIKRQLKKISFIKNFLEKRNTSKKFDSEYVFINRSKDFKKLCYILAGYKEFVWDVVFDRIQRFIPADIDVCIVSSGVYNEKLKTIAEENNWSYLYTKKNNISIVQNICLKLFESAEYVYKIDEDIFITDGFFEKMESCYKYVLEKSPYNPGCIAPLIPINGYGNIKILERYKLEKKYEELFEKPKYGGNKIMSCPEVAKFMWGKGGYVPHIDKINKDFASQKIKFSACPIRFSIGAIYFSKKLWTDIKFFDVRYKPVDLGTDEQQICFYCLDNSHPLIVSENTVVGHLSFGKQNKEMEIYYKENKENFSLNNEAK